MVITRHDCLCFCTHCDISLMTTWWVPTLSVYRKRAMKMQIERLFINRKNTFQRSRINDTREGPIAAWFHFRLNRRSWKIFYLTTSIAILTYCQPNDIIQVQIFSPPSKKNPMDLRAEMVKPKLCFFGFGYGFNDLTLNFFLWLKKLCLRVTNRKDLSSHFRVFNQLHFQWDF